MVENFFAWLKGVENRILVGFTSTDKNRLDFNSETKIAYLNEVID